MKKIFIIAGALLFITVLAYTRGFTKFPFLEKKQEMKTEPYPEPSPPDGDSVEVVGVPVKDDPWKQMDSLVRAMPLQNGMQISGNIKVIDDNNKQERILEDTPFEYTGFQDQLYYRLGNLEYIEKKNFSLIADHDSKVIGIVAKVEKKNPRPFDIALFRKMMEERKGNARVTELGEEKILTIDHITDPAIQGYRIYYSPKTFRISKMLVGMGRFSPISAVEENGKEESVSDDEEGLSEYYYYAEITYREMKALNLKKNQFRPEEKFIVRSNGKLLVKPEYSGYEILADGQ